MVLRVLNVAEKPSVAKSVAEILSHGRMRSREGRSRYNRVYEFDYSIRGQQCHMLFTSVTGHLMELEFDDRYRKWHSCDPADLFFAPVRKFVPEDKLDIKRTLEEESRKCQWLVLWLDCDREGENIAFEVIEVCADVNRHLNIWRARFSALIDREIHEAVQNLVQPNQLFADAVDARQEIDLRIGASFTRFQTLLLKDAFVLDLAGDARNMILSYGPCQFPTLGFIVERYWEIQSHEPEEFWTINCSHVLDEGIAKFEWMRGHLFDYASAVVIYEICVEESVATVKDVRQLEKLKYPPYPLSTVELQKRASKYFRISSDHTMKVAEDLYQAGYISYPRTETDSFSPNTDLHAIVREQLGHPSWGPYAQRLLEHEARLWRNPSNGGHDDKAHPPIHPTKYSPGEPGWSQDHNRLYELVVRHFLSCVSQPAVGAETKVEIDIAGEIFSTSGRVIIAKNYLDVYRFDSWGGSIIPTYNVGQQFIPTSLTLDCGVTRPPPLLSESDLLSHMDEASIGTDATMHDHIKKCLDRHYATKDTNTRFAPTKLGEALVMGYDDMGYELWKPFLRAEMECDMRRVSIGEKTKIEVLQTCLEQMKACFLDARLNKSKLLEAMENYFERSNRSVGVTNTSSEIVRPCNACHESNMVLRRNMNGSYMVGCANYPLCRNVVWLPGALSEATVTSEVCSSCSPGPVFRIQFKFRRLEIPPDFDVNHLGCIGGCDSILTQLIEICGTGSRHASSNTARAQRNMDPPANIGRGTSRQDSCTYCRQTGHRSRDCPYHVSGTRPQPTRTQNTPGSGQIMCNCEEPCTLQTANTESNRGRKFYSCRRCNFFVRIRVDDIFDHKLEIEASDNAHEWEDSLGNSGGQGRGAYNGNSSRSSSASASRRGAHGHGRGHRGAHTGDAGFVSARFVSATGETVSGACFSCGDPSHFANACPMRRR